MPEESTADGHHASARPDHPPTAGAARRPPLGRRLRATCRPRSCRGRDPRRRGRPRRRRPARRPDRQAHRPLARRTSSSSTSRRAATRSGGAQVNRPISEADYDRLRARLVAYCAERDLYSQDLLIGADPAHQRRLRVYTETAWASIFARNLFRRPDRRRSCAGFEPNFTIICVPSFQADPATEGTRTGTAILLHLERMEIIIVGTEYAGEIKKSAFTVMNYLMPDEGVLPMHSLGQRRAGRRQRRVLRPVGHRQDDALGRPGAQPHRRRRARLGPDGLFNFEGGCYAKTIRLSPMYEPDIFQTTRRFGTVLENVDLDPDTRELDLDSERFTENTRGAYPLHFIGNADPTGMTGQPRTVVLLTADAFGVLPPISRLTHAQAAYHFISGYTAKLAGTEVGVKEPKATFSACFGAPFMPRHPGEYARDADRAAGARTTPRSGSSTPAGPAVRTARASG